MKNSTDEARDIITGININEYRPEELIGLVNERFMREATVTNKTNNLFSVYDAFREVIKVMAREYLKPQKKTEEMFKNSQIQSMFRIAYLYENMRFWNELN